MNGKKKSNRKLTPTFLSRRSGVTLNISWILVQISNHGNQILDTFSTLSGTPYNKS